MSDTFDYKHLSQIEKYMASFASLFQNIKLARYDANGNIIKIINIPIVFAYKDKLWDLTNQVCISNHLIDNGIDVGYPIPSMSITIDFAGVNKVQYRSKMNQYKGDFVPTPCKFNFVLNLITKRTSDTLMISEQIIPRIPDFKSINVKINDNYNSEEVIFKAPLVELNLPTEMDTAKSLKIESTFTYETELNIAFVPPVDDTVYSLEIDVDGRMEEDDVLEEIIRNIV